MPHWLALYLWLKTHDKEDRLGEHNSWTVLKELRGLCLAAAAAQGFPWCQFRPASRCPPWRSCLVVPGRMAWEGMCQGAPIEDLADAILSLEVMAHAKVNGSVPGHRQDGVPDDARGGAGRAEAAAPHGREAARVA